MVNFFRKKQITFDCLIPGVERLMPMIPAKDFKHQWVKRAMQEYKNERNNPMFGMEKQIHTARCPGIFTLQRHGWIMRTWQDITIETFGDGNSMQWTTPISQKALNPQVGEYVGGHPEEQLFKFMNNWKKDTLSTLVKLTTPWRCTVPKGYYLLETQVAYADENRFTTVSGFFSREHGYAQLNPQLLWHVPVGKTLIKAGTPIAQYILVPKDSFDMNINVIGNTTDESFFNLVNNYRFVKNYSEVKKLYKD